ncbi:lipoyl synthase [Gottschalkiaceae bacterium SANA]|nr:lipoyl synthase [Gottschalkiaceae bacterium SANA]
MIKRKPEWLRIDMKAYQPKELKRVKALIEKTGLHTVCQEANCPNQYECFSKRTATFMILGSQCTRNCKFCNVTHGVAGAPDPQEPEKVAEAVESLGLKYAVITSVTRDDLSDGGAGHFAKTIRAIKARTPHVKVEVLIPDFQGNEAALQIVIDAAPEVINHNIETIARLYDTIRPEANYQQTLTLIQRVKKIAPAIKTKSGIMVGLGEKPAEVEAVMRDLHDHGCQMLTIGQYLAPSRQHAEVVEYVTPEQFKLYESYATALGFAHVSSGPFVRSSYHAADPFENQ